jgi:hypothetical protein
MALVRIKNTGHASQRIQYLNDLGIQDCSTLFGRTAMNIEKDKLITKEEDFERMHLTCTVVGEEVTTVVTSVVAEEVAETEDPETVEEYLPREYAVEEEEATGTEDETLELPVEETPEKVATAEPVITGGFIPPAKQFNSRNNQQSNKNKQH